MKDFDILDSKLFDFFIMFSMVIGMAVMVISLVWSVIKYILIARCGIKGPEVLDAVIAWLTK